MPNAGLPSGAVNEVVDQDDHRITRRTCTRHINFDACDGYQEARAYAQGLGSQLGLNKVHRRTRDI